MNRDLDSVLRDLAGAAAAAHHDRAAQDDGVLLVPTVRRVRRRRAVRSAAVGTGGLAVVAGLVLGGMALGQEPAPQPAGPSPSPSSTPTPTPTSTPTPTPPAVVLPTGDSSLPFGVCGSLSSSAPASPVDPAFLATAVPDATTVEAGGHVAVTTGVSVAMSWVEDGSPRPEGAVHGGGARVAVVRDGVVVATTTFGEDAWTYDGGYQGGIAFGVDWLPLEVCAPDGQPDVTAGAPLPAGTYELVPWSDVVHLGTSYDALPRDDTGVGVDVDAAIAALGEPRTATGPSSTLTVTGEARVMSPAPGAGLEPVAVPYPEQPLCGDPAPEQDPASPLRLTTSVDGATLRLADLTGVRTQLTYTGGGRTDLALGAVWMMVLDEGRVVAHSPIYYEAGSIVELGSGIPLEHTTAFLPPGACTPGDVVYTADGEVAPGTYDVLLAFEVLPLAPDGSALGWTSVVGERATLVVD